MGQGSVNEGTTEVDHLQEYAGTTALSTEYRTQIILSTRDPLLLLGLK
jgi:hypothetical protein